MNPLNSNSKVRNPLAWITLIISILALALALRSPSGQATQSKPEGPAQSTLTKVRKSGILKVGWGGFPPYTKMRPNETDPNKRVEGFMVDLVNEIAARHEPPLKVEWVLLQWETFRADLQSGKFDFIADPVYHTVGRAMDFRLCEPVSYFGIAVGLVRKDDNRFTTFDSIDREDVTVALAEGYTSSEYARKHLKHAKLKPIPVTTDAFVQLDDVLFGRADVALNDVPTVLQYARAHADKVKALWVETPPAVVAGGFLTRKEDADLADFLSAGTRILRVDGTIKRLDQIWKTLGMLPGDRLEAGEGLKN